MSAIAGTGPAKACCKEGEDSIAIARLVVAQQVNVTCPFEPDQLRAVGSIPQRQYLTAIDEGIDATCEQHQRPADFAETVDRPDVIG
ncbi:hypothetical protein EN788_65785, partial [Mesorhizobium sp. M2D.F.Ca.ET.145.01.1.1]